jgi:hypothetical protein
VGGGGGYTGTTFETVGLRRYGGYVSVGWGGWCLRCNVLYYDVEAIEGSLWWT